uniref:Retrotransposon protein, putative, Ty3-gypsy subclass n=1 Tax=Tanacetum cinerariifolium TaxID=118510 RepID=A0A6L2KZK3_TANCI|nr:retrotransposon protein, putative, Ty3-gypsy subclass [Tanacetum cinerariifolium]
MKDPNMRQRRWLDLLKDYDCEIRYHPGKANVLADALSQKEKEKITRIHSLRMIITSDLFNRIKAAQLEALKEENLKDFQEELRTRLHMSTTFHPQTDGQSKRTIQTLKDMLRACIIDFGGNWDDHLPLVEFAYNNSYHASIKMPPYEMLYGRKYRMPVCWDEVGSREIASTDVVLATIEKIETIRKRLKEAQDSVITLDEVEINPESTFQEEPITILGRKSRQLCNKEIPLVKVEWKHQKGTSIRWEPEEKMGIIYPHLFLE